MNTEILIIEDNPVIRKELQTVLEGNKYHTSVIEDFSDVTEQVRKINPHLILLDIKLPQENGFTICSGIRSFSQAPIIFVTSCNTDMDELNSIMLGGDAFITKPYHTAILLAKIASLLKRAYPAPVERPANIVLRDTVKRIAMTAISFPAESTFLPICPK